MLVLGAATATGLVLTALRDNVTYFHTPTEIVTGHYGARGRGVRLGGLVEKGSVKHDGDKVTFLVTDLANTLPVSYQGIVPDLFREGQGVVAEGKMDDGGVFVADRILAKHDEKYMPPEVAQALKDAPKPSSQSQP